MPALGDLGPQQGICVKDVWIPSLFLVEWDVGSVIRVCFPPLPRPSSSFKPEDVWDPLFMLFAQG